MGDLIPPHGGLSEPVSRSVPESERAAFESRAKSLPKVPVSDADLSTVYRFGDGALSPLTGPMDRATYEQVLDGCCVEHGGKRWAWTIPLSFPVTADLAAKLDKGQTVALVNGSGAIV